MRLVLQFSFDAAWWCLRVHSALHNGLVLALKQCRSPSPYFTAPVCSLTDSAVLVNLIILLDVHQNAQHTVLVWNLMYNSLRCRWWTRGNWGVFGCESERTRSRNRPYRCATEYKSIKESLWLNPVNPLIMISICCMWCVVRVVLLCFYLSCSS